MPLAPSPITRPQCGSMRRQHPSACWRQSLNSANSSLGPSGGANMDVRMDGRVAVITGASTGLGLATAKEFAASGASVAILARKADALASAKAEVVKAAGKTNAKIE